MAKKFFMLGIVWGAVILAYIVMGVSMPALRDITATASTEIGDPAGIVGIKDAVDSAPYWLWTIPGLVGLVVTVVMLKTDREI